MTLGDLASRIKVSASLLSQLERGGVNPSISLLKSISDCLAIPLASLLEIEENTTDAPLYLIRPGERKVLTTEGGVRFGLLTRFLNLNCEFTYDEFPPGSSTGREKYTHQGVECGLVLEGEIEVELEDGVYHLKAGDSITFKSDLPHRITNQSSHLSKAVWVNSHPWIFSTK